MSCETSSEPNPVREEIHVEVGREIRVDTPITMAQDGEGGGPPPMAPTNPFVKARNLPILVPQSLVVVDMSSHVSKFYGTKDEDPSRHMERYIENLASSFVTNLGYWLV